MQRLSRLVGTFCVAGIVLIAAILSQGQLESPALAAPGKPTATPAPPGTPDLYAGLGIDDLAARNYGSGTLDVVQTMDTGDDFTRSLIAYSSDGLSIYGFMDVPPGDGPFPVIIALHGYIDPAAYYTLDYTTLYADALARAGYLVLHPNLRGYPPSDSGPNLFRVGMAIDVLNLIALVREVGGTPGPLQAADPERIGLWGHSMGGGISLRVLTVSQDVDAAVLYSAMSGDDEQNFAAIREWSGKTRGLDEEDIPEDVYVRVSPIFYLDRIQAPVSIHHGGADELVPLEWSEDLCTRLRALGKPVECYTYDGQPHTFVDDGNALFIQRTIRFFDAQLKYAVMP
ncbi:alpha/beta hydrolase family protein [Aggregatilinea lenta]|uniref:alpha/beta hydrolase family protein n=1 Tax=Aggregatilinea lenta TaxID=913108 RepID=UPI000E5A4029|nr:alpha/beta fold hydrolase [Aggregatilinea lenta]